MAEKCEFEERVCVDCEITVDCQCDVAKKKRTLKELGSAKLSLKPWEVDSASGHHWLFCPRVLEGKRPNSKPGNRQLTVTLSIVVKFSWVSISKCLSRIPLGESVHQESTQANARQICIRSEMWKTYGNWQLE